MASTYYMSAISLIVQYLTNLGLIAAGGQVYTYEAGTTTPVTTYTDATGFIENPNPLTLSSSGRPVSQSGAPIAFWVPSGTAVKLIVTDAIGNQLVYLDNIPAINDPSGPDSLETLLATPPGDTGGSGVTLVANAIQSYDVVSSVQAANAPTPVAGQTVIICTEGQVTVGDGFGGTYFWSPNSSATDDGGVTTIAPANAGATGRFLRILPNAEGSFTPTWTGFTSSPAGTFYWFRIGNIVTLFSNQSITGTSNSTAMTVTNLPAEIQPTMAQNIPFLSCEDNGVGGQLARATIGPGNSLAFDLVTANTSTGVISAAVFTASGTKGISTFCFSYALN
jgi:hypothetical protein